LRADWIRIYDLAYVEDELIAGIETYIKDADKYMGDLQLKAQGLAAAEAAKEEASRTGTAGLGEVVKRGVTRAVSPRLTRARPPKFHEPITIEQTVSHSVLQQQQHCTVVVCI
jgi:hypothetical protein